MIANMLPVKREVVSIMNAMNVDTLSVKVSAMDAVYSSKPHSLIGVQSSCKRCLKERARGNQKWRQKNKQKPTKANTPIVIQLKDTLKAALKQKQRSLADTSLRCRIRENEVCLDKTKESTMLQEDESSSSLKHLKTKNDVKNLSALISVIEKSHQKDKYNIGTNFTHSVQNRNSKLVADYVLNNASYTSHDTLDQGSKPRNIVECENVDLICNDLNSSEKSSVTTEDTEESENGSTISSSEIQSDSDISVTYPENSKSEMSQEELERLAVYTTGCPLIRYNCPPSECPQCLSEYYSSQYYYSCDDTSLHFHKYLSTEQEDQAELASTETTANTETEEESETEALPQSSDSPVDADISSTGVENDDDDVKSSELSHNAQTFVSKSRNPNHSGQKKSEHQRQLLDIDIAGRGGKSLQDVCPDSVYIDLTDTDVTFTVYYHHEKDSNHSNHNSLSIYAMSNCTPSGVTITPQSWQPGMAFQPSSRTNVVAASSYMTVAHWYWPYVHSPVYNVSPSFCVPQESLDIPKKALIPPQELHSFTSSQPPNRQWVCLNNQVQNRPAAIFTVMCYNVLCDKYCTRQLYGYCPNWALNWEYRKKGIMEEIKHCAADVICLQEVETDQFYNFFLPELKRDGYDGIFSAKSRARTMTESERKYVDGCAIFYRTTKFSLVKEHLIEFNQLAMANAEGSDNMLNRVMTKDNIGLAAMLETKDGTFENSIHAEGQPRQQMMVATAHIHWDPEFCDVKLIQTMMLMWELKHIIEESVRSFRPGAAHPDINSIPLILCGDLNSLPNSGVIEFLTSGKVARNHEDFKEHGYEECLQRLNNTSDKEALTHDFLLNRAYDNEVMPYTNYTYDFKGIIDYIFYSRDHLNILGLLGPLDEEWFRQNKVIGCPHPHVPSDHFPLLVEFEMPMGLPDGSRPNTGGNKSR